MVEETAGDGVEAEARTAAPPVDDEWAGLRSVLAGDDDPAPFEDDDDDALADDEVGQAAEEFLASWTAGGDEVGDIVGDTDDDIGTDTDPLAEAVADLTERVELLATALDEARAERAALADQLDRLASELDAILSETLDEERAKREQLEDALHEVQTTLAEGATPAPTYDGPERRAGAERRVSGDRRRVAGRRERPLRARDFTPEPEPAAVDHVDEGVGSDDDERPSLWKSRLHEVAGSVSAWSSDDVDRLRTD